MKEARRLRALAQPHGLHVPWREVARDREACHRFEVIVARRSLHGLATSALPHGRFSMAETPGVSMICFYPRPHAYCETRLGGEKRPRVDPNSSYFQTFECGMSVQFGPHFRSLRPTTHGSGQIPIHSRFRLGT